MASEPIVSIRHPLARALLVLTFTTGLVDAVSFLGLGRVFTANMTGNIVFLGFGVAGSGGLPVLAPLISLGFFLLGAAGGGVLAGARNATVRRIGVPDLTTTVLTMTLTGLAGDSPPAGGKGKGSVRRIAAVLAMFSGALAGALLLKTSLVLPLTAAAGLALATWLYAEHHRELGSSYGNA